LPVLLFSFPLPFGSFVAHRVPNRDHPFGHAAHPVAHLLLESARFFLNLFHRPRQYPSAII
jgi:hypothetical protein